MTVQTVSFDKDPAENFEKLQDALKENPGTGFCEVVVSDMKEVSN
jgi:hypothetical protein